MILSRSQSESEAELGLASRPPAHKGIIRHAEGRYRLWAGRDLSLRDSPKPGVGSGATSAPKGLSCLPLAGFSLVPASSAKCESLFSSLLILELTPHHLHPQPVERDWSPRPETREHCLLHGGHKEGVNSCSPSSWRQKEGVAEGIWASGWENFQALRGGWGIRG